MREGVAAGLLLGLVGGSFCLTACAPVLVPAILAEGRSARSNVPLLAAFLSGRFVGYVGFAAAAWSAGLLVRQGALLQRDPAGIAALEGAAYLALGIAMALYGIVAPRTICAGALAGRVSRGRTLARPPLLPAILGLLTGLSPCPPLLAAVVEAAGSKSLLHAVLFFVAFFIGTSLLFVPFPALGVLRRYPAVRTVGRLTSVVVGLIYCYIGIGVLV